MFYLRILLGVLAFVAASMYGVMIAVVRRDKSCVARDYAHTLARWMRPVLGVKVVVHHEERMYAARPCIYISNHQTVFDVPVLAGLYPAGTVVIAKREIRSIPFFGWLYEVTGNVLIDRSDRSQAVGRLKGAEAAILERGASVWIFPEGTRGKVPGEMLPFKKGAFHMAVATGVPLVPVVVSPLREIFDMQRRRIHPGTAEVEVLEPIPTAGLGDDDIPALIEEAHRRMQATLTELAARHLPTPSA